MLFSVKLAYSLLCYYSQHKGRLLEEKRICYAKPGVFLIIDCLFTSWLRRLEYIYTDYSDYSDYSGYSHTRNIEYCWS